MRAFVVNHCQGSTLSLARNVSVEIVRTKVAHQINDTHTSLKICGLHVESHFHAAQSYSISEVVDEVPEKLQEHCKERKAHVPAKLVKWLRQGFPEKDNFSVVLP